MKSDVPNQDERFSCKIGGRKLLAKKEKGANFAPFCLFHYYHNLCIVLLPVLDFNVFQTV